MQYSASKVNTVALGKLIEIIYIFQTINTKNHKVKKFTWIILQSGGLQITIYYSL